jgi:hypothetical protein
LKSYEIEIAQVLGNLGTLTDRDEHNLEKEPKPASTSKPAEDFPDIEMSFSDDTVQEEFLFETGGPLGQPEHLEETEGQPSAGRNEEDLEIPHKHKLAKSQKQIRKLKKENKLLKKKAKRVVILKQKVGKLKEIIKELRKQLELVDKIHKRKKNKKGRMQGRNPLPKKAASTTSIGIQTYPK